MPRSRLLKFVAAQRPKRVSLMTTRSPTFIGEKMSASVLGNEFALSVATRISVKPTDLTIKIADYVDNPLPGCGDLHMAIACLEVFCDEGEDDDVEAVENSVSLDYLLEMMIVGFDRSPIANLLSFRTSITQHWRGRVFLEACAIVGTPEELAAFKNFVDTVKGLAAGMKALPEKYDEDDFYPDGIFDLASAYLDQWLLTSYRPEDDDGATIQ